MPWKETCVDEERMRFIVALKQGGWTMTDLCAEFGISRKTGYKYLDRYSAGGIKGLKDQSRAPKNQPRAVREKLVELILEARREHPNWGARKLLAALAGRYPQIQDWPHPNTFGRILKRNGMIKKRKRRRKKVQLFPLSHVLDPNDVWCVDYKGHFTVGNGKRCDPLTISDAYSRFLLDCKAVPKTDTKSAQEVFTAVFKEYGLPNAIRSDNGSPFASSQSLAGLSRLSVWWLKLGIQLERIEPGKPYQNGRHERMHWTLKQETALPPRSSLELQQLAFENFKREYNYERPHEALKNRTPSQLYKPSNRSFPDKIEVAYPTNMETYVVSDEGTIRYGTLRVFLSSALRNEPVGIEEISERHRRIHFASATIGVLDAFTGNLLQYKNPAPIDMEMEDNSVWN